MSDLAYQGGKRAAAEAHREDDSVAPEADARLRRKHFVDLDLSIGGVYFRLIVGRERRSSERRKQERDAKPLSTLGNMLFAGSISGVVFTVLVVVALVYSSILAE